MNSKKAWATIRRLGIDQCPPLPRSLLSLLTKSLTNYCLMEEGWNTEGHPASTTKQSFPSNNQPPSELTKPFSLEELATGLSLLKAGIAAGLDDLLTEMLQQ